MRSNTFLIACVLWPDRLEIAARYVGGSDGEQPVDDDTDAELLAVAGDLADDPLEVSSGDDDGVAFLEVMVGIGDDDIVGFLLGADNLQRLHLMVGDDERLGLDAAAETSAAIVEAEVGKVDIVIDKGLERLFGAVGKKEVGKT